VWFSSGKIYPVCCRHYHKKPQNQFSDKFPFFPSSIILYKYWSNIFYKYLRQSSKNISSVFHNRSQELLRILLWEQHMSPINFWDRSRIYKRTISLRFLGIILKVIRLEVSVYNVYLTNQFQTTFTKRGVKFILER